MQPRFRIEVLARQPQVDLRRRSMVYPRLAKGFISGFPRRLARLVQRQYGRSQVIRDQVVVAGFFEALACCKVSLPDGVGAPQAAFLCVFVLLVGSGLLRMGVESVRSGDPAFFISFGH